MSALLPVTVNGVEYQVHGEYTSAKVAGEFQNSLAAFVNIFNLGLDNATPLQTPPGPGPFTDADKIIYTIEQDSGYVNQLIAALTGGTVTSNYNLNPSLVPATNPPRTEIDNQVMGLLNLLKNGMNVTDDPVLSPGQHYLSLEMAGALEQLIRSLQMAGVQFTTNTTTNTLEVVPSTINATTIKNWRNLAATSDAIRRIMQYAVDTSGNQNRTLQALVELIYVRTGNELLSDSLERLEDAISITKESLDTLTRLQTLHNKLTAEERAKFEDTFTGYQQTTVTVPDPINIGQLTTITGPAADPTSFVDGVGATTAGGFTGVASAAEAHFEPIDPILSDEITEADRIEFMSLRRELIEQIALLSGQTGAGEGDTLLSRLKTVLGDINKAFSAIDVSLSELPTLTDVGLITSALTRWILDSTGAKNTSLNIPGIESGGIQRNLTAAFSAGQSLNDTQKEEVRRYLFVFEEYYKSAASILSKITQILERMAQAISR